MKSKASGLILALLVLFAVSARAQNYKMGLGVRFGNSDALINTSLSAKYFLSERTALEGLLSFKPLALGLLVEQHQPLTGNRFQLFYGGGLYGAFSGSRIVGLQGVLGLDYKVPALPLNFSVDWKPELTLAREFSFEPAAVGLSARFTFKD